MTKANLTSSQLDSVAARIEQVAPPERTLRVSEAIRRLAPAIRKMQSRGHTADSIRAALAAEGVPASLRAIRQVLAKPPARSVDKSSAPKSPPVVPAECTKK